MAGSSIQASPRSASQSRSARLRTDIRQSKLLEQFLQRAALAPVPVQNGKDHIGAALRGERFQFENRRPIDDLINDIELARSAKGGRDFVAGEQADLALGIRAAHQHENV